MKRTPPPWTGEKLYFKGDDYFRDLLAAIRGARQNLDFETYLFEPGRLGDRLVAALAGAARRGVRVRLLVDGVGSPEFAGHYGPGLARAGAAFRVYRSWPVIFSTARRLLGWGRLGRALRQAHGLLSSGNRRDHRKLCLVDDRQVWMGSFNVSDWNLAELKGSAAWRDTGLRLSGVAGTVFRQAFRLAWEDRWPRPWGRRRVRRIKRWIVREVVGGPIRLTLTRRLRAAYRRELTERFQLARRRIWILTPYFTPTRSLLRALARAARRGCDVRLVLP
ncbi:MAG TPA: phospholipase D-like domain-containing protein, partial [bacterium]|nr:phospholipase D-like domain-containing protein [bacterium]